MSTITIPKILANFETSLAATMSAAATTLTLNASVDGDGTTLSGLYSLTFDEGTSSEEHMLVTMTGASGAVSRRGLSRVDAWTEVTANKLVHNRGASVKVTNVSALNIQRLLNGDETFNSVNWLGVNSITGLATPTAGETTKAANIAYVNAVAIAGASDATTTTKGIVEEATQAEIAAGTAAGATAARLFTNPSTLAPHVQSGAWLYAAEDGSGSDDTYTAALTPALTAYTTGMVVTIKITVANTGACTLNLNGLGAKNIKKYATGALADPETGDIVANQFCMFYYDGTQMVLINPGASMPTTALLTEMGTFFGATDITGAEAQTLTGGVASNADALHTHIGGLGFRSFVIPTMLQALDTGRFQISFTPDLSYAFSAVSQGASPNKSMRVQRHTRDSVSGNYYYDGTTIQLDAGNLTADPNADEVAVIATASYVYAAFINGGTNIVIARMAQDLTGLTQMTISGTAMTTLFTSGFGNDTDLYFKGTSTTVYHYTISGTTATRTTDITLTSAGDGVAGWDGSANIYISSPTASDLTWRKYPIAGGAASTTSVRMTHHLINDVGAVNDDDGISISAGMYIDSSKLYFATLKLYDNTTTDVAVIDITQYPTF
jgi:hypothetical protein